MNTIICFRQGGNNLRIGNTLVWLENAIDWCKKNDFTFWLPEVNNILGELFDKSSSCFTVPTNWDKSIFYDDARFYSLLARIVATMNEVKSKGSVSNFVFACSVIPGMIAYIEPQGDTDWSNIPRELICFLKEHNLVIVNSPYPFKLTESSNTTSYLKPSQQSIEFVNKLSSNHKTKIGIHIRQGDYKNWQGGRYYQTSDFYNELISSILQYKHNHIIDYDLLIVHSGEFELSEANKNLLKSHLTYPDQKFSDAIRDFLVLSSCNLVIGPLSTFSRQALKWGENYHSISGKWLPIDSQSNILDIVNQIDH